MATCLQTLSENLGVETVTPNIKYDITIDVDKNKIFLLSLETSQTVFIDVYFIKSLILPSIFFISFIDKKTLNTTNTVKITDSTLINITLDIGDYYVCVRTPNISYNVSLNFKFIKYRRDLTFNINCLCGESFDIDNLIIKKEYVNCNQPLKYTLIDGELPSGVTINDKGMISGRLPLIDTENKRDFPSYNLYHDDYEDSSPIGIRYDFKIKVELVSDPNKFEIRKFCIHIVNDWDLSLPEYMDDYEDIKYSIVNKYINVNLPNSLCPPCGIDIEDIKTSQWYYNDYNSITRDNYESQAIFIDTIEKLDYVIEQYESNLYDLSSDDDDINSINVNPTVFVNSGESVLIPNEFKKKPLEYIKNNLEYLIDYGYDEEILNKYIDGKLEYESDEIDGEIFIHIKNDEYVDIVQDTYNAERISIMKNEPIYVVGNLSSENLQVEITYEQRSY